MLFINIGFIVSVMPNVIGATVAGFIGTLFYLYFNIVPRRDKLSQWKLQVLIGGHELMLIVIACFTMEIIIYTYVIVKNIEISLSLLIANGILCACLLSIMLLNGLIRIFTCSSQLGIMPRIYLLFFWWVPIINIILLKKFITVSTSEYQFTVRKYRLDLDRKYEEVCRTKYPILMVHGIFFRDWKSYNYWGRIPKQLTDNGATIYYGNHQSAASIEACATELKKCILNIVQETSCEKVNIIAHSKGGLDSRYAISVLGMGEFVASLTTINTPHEGCNFLSKLLAIIPKKTVMAIGKKYEDLYTKLGDDSPNFFDGLKDLTDIECARLNYIMNDDSRVLYQSVGSRMLKPSGAMFPLNLGYSIIKYLGNADNDGLVSTKSMEWGNFLGILSPKGKTGISHGDIIDLTRKNIEGFDVGEFYVDMVNKLKVQGF